MKKIVISLVAILVILIGGLVFATAGKFNIYTDTPHVNYDEVLDDPTTPTIYYYYQDTCHFCNSIKDQVTDLYFATEASDKVNLVLVDMKSSANANAWTSDPTYDPQNVDVTDAKNIQVTGTPTMAYVEDGKLAEYEVGSDVFTLMENINQQFELGLTFDPSRYGK